MAKYMAVMSAYGRNEGINFKFGGKVANTIDEHRLIQHYQEGKGPKVTDKIVSCKQLPSFSSANLLWLCLPFSKEKMKLTKRKRRTASNLKTKRTHEPRDTVKGSDRCRDFQRRKQKHLSKTNMKDYRK